MIERQTKVAIPEIKLGENIFAQFAVLTQLIDDNNNVVEERAEILWGVTKEQLIERENKRIAIAQSLIQRKQAEIVEAEAAKTEITAIGVAVPV